jgi:transglutaminase-like putative cysteine protease
VNYRVSHVTTYRYEELASVCHNELRLTPRAGTHQRPRRTQLRVDPAPSALIPHLDFFGRQLVITAKSDVEVTAAIPPEATPPWEAVRERLRHDRSADALDAYQFVFESPRVAPDEDVVAYAAPSFPEGRDLLEAVRDLTGRIHTEFAYDQSATTVATPVADVLRDRRGVCQDFAHLEIACLRGLGLSARYVSGYILTTPPPGTARLVGTDASHAWVSVWLGDAGWVDVDPTNDQLPSDQHVTVAWGRDYADVSPLRGVVLGGGEHQVTVAVDVAPLDDAADARRGAGRGRP